MSAYRQITDEERRALETFAIHFGRNKWRDQLNMVYWYNACLWRGPMGDDPNIGSVLHGIRNDLGPTWLYDVYKPAKVAA